MHPNKTTFFSQNTEFSVNCTEKSASATLFLELIECFDRCTGLQFLPRSEIDFFWILMILLSVYFSKETPFVRVNLLPLRTTSHAHIRAHIRAYARLPTAMLFFCCHKCHTRCKFGWKNLLFLDNEEEKQSHFRSLILCIFGT